MRELYLKGFEIVIKEAAPGAVMTAYNKLNGCYCANHFELCSILRDEWGFGGLVMTDWFSTGKDRSDEAQAIRGAGVDLIMLGSKAVKKKLKKAWQEGKLSEADIRQSCGHVLEAVLCWRDHALAESGET